MTVRTLDRALRGVALALGILLLVAGGRVLATRGLGHDPGPDAVQGAGWVATDIEVLQLRDDSGRRVLVLRGMLLPDSGGPPPLVTAFLLDGSGASVGSPYQGVLVRLGEEDLSPRALSAALAPGAVPPRPDGGPLDGFTVLIPDPAPEARRFQLSLQPRA